MSMINPLVKELIIRAAGEFLDDGAEIVGDDAAILMTFEVGLDAAAVEILAKLRTEHVQDPASFIIREIVEHIIRRIISAADDGIDVVADAGDESRAAIKLVKHSIAPVFVSVIKCFVI